MRRQWWRWMVVAVLVLLLLLVGKMVCAQVTAQVSWTAEQIRIEVPEPYRIWFAQISWVEASPGLQIVDAPTLLYPLPGAWQDGAYNPDCITCDADPNTVVGIANYIDFAGGGFQGNANARVISWSWGWGGNGTVTLGNELLCPGFRNNPVHLWVHDKSKQPTDPLYDQVWYCDSIETQLGVQPGALTWDVLPLVINDTPLAVTQTEWSRVKALYR